MATGNYSSFGNVVDPHTSVFAKCVQSSGNVTDCLFSRMMPQREDRCIFFSWPSERFKCRSVPDIFCNFGCDGSNVFAAFSRLCRVSAIPILNPLIGVPFLTFPIDILLFGTIGILLFHIQLLQNLDDWGFSQATTTAWGRCREGLFQLGLLLLVCNLLLMLRDAQTHTY